MAPPTGHNQLAANPEPAKAGHVATALVEQAAHMITTMTLGVQTRVRANNVRNHQVVEKVADVVVERAKEKARVKQNQPRLAAPNILPALDHTVPLGLLESRSPVPGHQEKVVGKWVDFSGLLLFLFLRSRN